MTDVGVIDGKYVVARTLYVYFGLAGNDAYPSTRISYEVSVCRIKRRNSINI